MAKSAPDLLDELYAAPLAAFVATRARLAAELRKAGDKQAASVMKNAGKPTVSAWAVNQAVRRAPEALRRVLAASDALRDAQLQATGGESRQRYQDAVAEHRRAVDLLTSEAETALSDGGQKPSPALRERIAGNLRWSPQSQESRSLLEAGRLIKDVGPQDFGTLALMAGGGKAGDGGKVIPFSRPAPAAAAGKAAAVKGDAASTRAAEAAEIERQREADRARRVHLTELRAELRARNQEVDQARKQSDKARAQRERAQARVEELEATLVEAKQALTRAREDEKQRAAELVRAEKSVQSAALSVSDLEQE